VGRTFKKVKSRQIPFSHTAKRIEDIFESHKDKLGRVIKLALKFRTGMQEIDPFIQQHTSSICGKCSKKCCVNKHACYTCEDLVYIYALDLSTREYGERDESQHCYFLSAAGCRLERALRPSGCNWYFCDGLYASMEKAPGRAYADFDDSLRDLTSLWMELINEFLTQYNAISGHKMHIADLIYSSYRRADSPSPASPESDCI
jgi:hypothetical protein